MDVDQFKKDLEDWLSRSRAEHGVLKRKASALAQVPRPLDLPRHKDEHFLAVIEFREMTAEIETLERVLEHLSEVSDGTQ